MSKTGNGLKEKDLVGIPWRVAFALQADGWYLRSDIIWSKPNPMPESVTDRPTKAHEYVFLLSKSQRYFYDADAVREEANTEEMEYRNKIRADKSYQLKGDDNPYESNFPKHYNNTSGRNRRTVWTIATQPYSGAHFATFPEALVEPCIKAGTSERGCCPECGKPWVRVVKAEGGSIGKHMFTEENYKANGFHINNDAKGGNGYKRTDLGFKPACTHDHAPIPCTVFDPFAGTATVGVVANRFGRSFVGLDLSLDYIHLAEERIKKSNGYHVGRLL